MTTRVIVNGALGKMGSITVTTIQQHPDFELVGALSKQDNLRAVIKDTEADIVIDLTRADVVYANSLAIIESGARPVIGSSGLEPDQISHLTALCAQQDLGGIIAPNFSIGAVLLMRFSAEAARYLPDVEIVESHHPQKYDKPSGTAKKTAEMIASVTASDIPIHSIRLPGILAKQEVIFGNTGETLCLTHNSIDRLCFMPGVVLCCQKVLHLKSLYYGLDTLL